MARKIDPLKKNKILTLKKTTIKKFSIEAAKEGITAKPLMEKILENYEPKR